MTTPALSALDSVVSQMHQLARAAANTPATYPTTHAVAPSGFAQELQRSLDKLASTQHAANAKADAFMTGTSSASLSDVMIDMQKASLAFQTTVQVRNRLVEAYQSVASMPV